MPDLTSIADATLAALPWQMRTGPWGAFVRTLAGRRDALLARAKAAVKMRWPATAPDGALRYLGADRQLPQFPGETTAQYRARLVGAMELWGAAGTARGLLALLAAVGFVDGDGAPSARVYDVWSAPSWWPGGAGAWPPAPRGSEPGWWGAYAAHVGVSPTPWPPIAGSDACRALWSRVWVELPEPAVMGWPPWGWQRVRWGQAPWGSFTWGATTATAAQVRFLRGVIRAWVPAHVVCESIFVRFLSGYTVTWRGE